MYNNPNVFEPAKNSDEYKAACRRAKIVQTFFKIETLIITRDRGEASQKVFSTTTRINKTN